MDENRNHDGDGNGENDAGQPGIFANYPALRAMLNREVVAPPPHNGEMQNVQAPAMNAAVEQPNEEVAAPPPHNGEMQNVQAPAMNAAVEQPNEEVAAPPPRNGEMQNVQAPAMNAAVEQPNENIPEPIVIRAGVLELPTKTRLKITVNKLFITAEWKWDKGRFAQDECGICRTAFETCCAGCTPGDGCPVVHGVCGHALHKHCMQKWLEAQQEQDAQTCPLCREAWNEVAR